MIRKLSDLDYKDLKNFLPSFEFTINTTLSSATKHTPFIWDCSRPANQNNCTRKDRGAACWLRDNGPGNTGRCVTSFWRKCCEAHLGESCGNCGRSQVHLWRTKDSTRRGSATTWTTLWNGPTCTFIGHRAFSMLKWRRGKQSTSTYVEPATIVKKIGSHSFQMSFFNLPIGSTQLVQRDAGMIVTYARPRGTLQSRWNFLTMWAQEAKKLHR